MNSLVNGVKMINAELMTMVVSIQYSVFTSMLSKMYFDLTLQTLILKGRITTRYYRVIVRSVEYNLAGQSISEMQAGWGGQDVT